MFDYKESKKRINTILNSKTKIRDETYIPSSDSDYTYDNGIRAWVGSIFVDIVNSRELFKDANENVARLIRAFSQEIILVMKESSLYRQIGIRGDCVYGIFDVATKDAVYELVVLSFQINTLITLLNKQLVNNNQESIQVGIGVATNKDLIIKAGVSHTGINDRVWIGQAVVKASHLADMALRHEASYHGPILMDSTSYINAIDKLSSDSDFENEWIKNLKIEDEIFYYADIYYTSIDTL